jgi:Fic family protein
MRYIHQHKDWPKFTWNNTDISRVLAHVRHQQGLLMGRMDGLGFKFKEEAVLQTLTLEIIKSSEIEGEKLNEEQVRSSLARRLGMDIPGLIAADRNVEGIVEMMLDATQRYDEILTTNRLFGWHSSLFPSGWSGMYKLTIGSWRNHEKGPMQVVSGGFGKELVHFEAPHADLLEAEMKEFLDWFNDEKNMDPVLKAAIAHLWFVTIHPFDDGNGRIGRTIADMQLARSDGSAQRFYSMSTEIRKQRKGYYDILEKTQKGNLDITKWLLWFLECLEKGIINSDKIIENVLSKSRFWKKCVSIDINERQKLMINKLLDGFDGKLNTSKWAKIAKCSHDTALRDINDLIQKGLMIKEDGGSKNTSYVLNLDGIQ